MQTSYCSNDYFIGVDVGTKSVRASLINSTGKLLNLHVSPIQILNPEVNIYEQSSEEIWSSVCTCVKKVVTNIDISSVKGIGFDATCSLVILDTNLSPLSPQYLSGDENSSFNIIMWMDHRAQEEADFINSRSHEVLKYVGGKISLEMQVPKLLWIKKHQPKCWQLAKNFLDLPDFLTFKSTGNLTRSLCSLVCKWNYRPTEAGGQGWDKNFFSSIGLDDLLENNCEKIGKEVLAPGECCGALSKKAAIELGLPAGTPVGSSLIDAHAGGLALVSSGLMEKEDMAGRLALICGTSTCHMCISENPIFVNGVWGPYFSAMVPNFWLNEGGQSATGCLVDHLIQNHPAVKSCPKNKDVYAWLELLLEEMAQKKKIKHVSSLCKDIHIYPDFHGNRSPLADPNSKGMINGLTLDDGEHSLALLYLATLQSLAYGTKDITEQLTFSGHQISKVLMCGGLSKSKLFIQTHADVLGLPVLIPENKESVLLGAAMLGAAASKFFGINSTLKDVAKKMGSPVKVFQPNSSVKGFHDKKYRVFKKMQKDQTLYREIME